MGLMCGRELIESFPDPSSQAKSILLIGFLVFNQGWLLSQETNLDCKLIDIGPIRQTVTNMATFGSGWADDIITNPVTAWRSFSSSTGQETYEHGIPGFSEYPAGSHCIYGDWGPWFAGNTSKGALVSTGGPISIEEGGIYASPWELFATAAPWDTVWVVNRGDTVDIPYWRNYTAVSDQDHVTRFNDYSAASLVVADHVPLDIEVIQVTYAWNSLEFLVHSVLDYTKRGRHNGFLFWYEL